jgi:hypothetical protein
MMILTGWLAAKVVSSLGPVKGSIKKARFSK